MSASITTSRNVLTTSRAVAATSAAPATSRAVAVSSQPVVASSQPVVSSQIATSRSTTRRARTTTASATPTPTQTVVPFDASSERRADSQRTNKILIGIFTGFGVILLGLVAFQLLRCYKRRRKSNTPLPPPREGTMSQLGYRHSRAVSVYKDFPAADFSRPPSMMKHASGSGFVDTPSVRSNAASMEKLRADEPARTSSDPRRSTSQIPREASPDNSLVDSTIVDSTVAPTDEEMGRRLSPLGSPSQSPSNLSLPRPPSQAQVQPRPESRARYPRPNSVASTARHSYLAPSWQYGPAQRNSVHGSMRPTSYYASGNHGAPHSPHARDRVGLVMPQPLAPELFNYALSGRHDMGLDFTQGGWGSHGNIANPQDSNSTLAPPMRTRTDSWVGQSRTPSSSDSPLTSGAPAKDGSLPRGRRPEIP